MRYFSFDVMAFYSLRICARIYIRNKEILACFGFSPSLSSLLMSVLLLLVIYLIFISLGLPDSVLGSAFPAIAENLETSPDMAGYIGFVVSLCTIISSLLSERMIKRFTTKFVVSFSILLTALGLVCFHLVSKDYVWAFFQIGRAHV